MVEFILGIILKLRFFIYKLIHSRNSEEPSSIKSSSGNISDNAKNVRITIEGVYNMDRDIRIITETLQIDKNDRKGNPKLLMVLLFSSNFIFCIDLHFLEALMKAFIPELVPLISKDNQSSDERSSIPKIHEYISSTTQIPVYTWVMGSEMSTVFLSDEYSIPWIIDNVANSIGVYLGNKNNIFNIYRGQDYTEASFVLVECFVKNT